MPLLPAEDVVFPSWTTYFFSLAEAAAAKSKDPSTKVGAAIAGPSGEIRSLGFNGFPRRVDDSPYVRYQRPEKYLWTEHAERNAIYNAARAGIALQDCDIYVTHPPCVDCVRAIIQTGIRNIHYRAQTLSPHWDDHTPIAEAMLKESGVIVHVH